MYLNTHTYANAVHAHTHTHSHTHTLMLTPEHNNTQSHYIETLITADLHNE